MSTVLVVGATGHVGRPVARRLLADGHCVRVLVRDEGRARQVLGEGFRYVPGVIQDREVVARAVQGSTRSTSALPALPRPTRLRWKR